MAQWQSGDLQAIPDEHDVLVCICSGPMSVRVRKKFISITIDGDKYLQNERLAHEWQRAKTDYDKAVKGAAKRWNAQGDARISFTRTKSGYEALFVAVGRRDGFSCAQCHTDKRIELDHVVPVSFGGVTELHNLQLLCRDCNMKKGVHQTDYRKNGSKPESNGTNARDGHLVDAQANAPAMLSHNSHKNTSLSVKQREKARTQKRRVADMSDDEFLSYLQEQPAYSKLDVRALNSKMVVWCAVNGKQPTRRRLTNWLNREDQPIWNSDEKEKQRGLNNGTARNGARAAGPDRRVASVCAVPKPKVAIGGDDDEPGDEAMRMFDPRDPEKSVAEDSADV
jgi:5-methylcytosine-specific restriction endonuclease McrA